MKIKRNFVVWLTPTRDYINSFLHLCRLMTTANHLILYPEGLVTWGNSTTTPFIFSLWGKFYILCRCSIFFGFLFTLASYICSLNFLIVDILTSCNAFVIFSLYCYHNSSYHTVIKIMHLYKLFSCLIKCVQVSCRV